MKREEKQAVVEELSALWAGSSCGIIVHYRGLTVAQLTDLRRKLREAGGNIRVVKNTLARRAVQAIGFKSAESLLKGPSAVAAGKDPVAVAKVITEFVKKNDKMVLIGGVLDGKKITPAEINALASLPSREVLLAKMVGSLQSPISGFVRTLGEIPTSFVRVLASLRDARGGDAA